MVLGALELKVGVAQLALLGAEVFKVLGAVVSVAELVLVVHPRAVLAAVGGSEEAGGAQKPSHTSATLHRVSNVRRRSVSKRSRGDIPPHSDNDRATLLTSI